MWDATEMQTTDALTSTCKYSNHPAFKGSYCVMVLENWNAATIIDA